MTCFSLYPHGNLLLSKISKPTTLKTENTNLSILSLEGTPIAMPQANPIIWKMRAVRTVKNNRFCSITISHNHIPSPDLAPEIQTHTATTEQTSLSGYLIGISNLTCSKNPILSFPLFIVCSQGHPQAWWFARQTLRNQESCYMHVLWFTTMKRHRWNSANGEGTKCSPGNSLASCGVTHPMKSEGMT